MLEMNSSEMAMKILIADDDDLLVKLLEHRLGHEGYEVISVGDGAEALVMAFEAAPDLIVLDGMMPGLDGFEVLRRLKENEKTRATPVVMLTARGMERDVVAGLDLGAEEYMVKPFMPNELTTRINRILKEKRAK